MLKLKKYILLLVALGIYLIGTILYFILDSTFYSILYMFIIFLVIGLIVLYLSKIKKEL